MARIQCTAAAVALGLALVSTDVMAQRPASVSLIHTVLVTVPPRVKVQVAPAQSNLKSDTGRTGLAVSVNATRGWVLVLGSKKQATSSAQWVANSGERTSSMVVYRNNASERAPGNGGATVSEPMMLTVVAP